VKIRSDFRNIMLLSLFDNLIQPSTFFIPEKDKKESYEIVVNGRAVKVQIIFEERFNNRVVVNSKGITIRISKKQPKEEQRKNIDTFIQWAKNKLDEKPDLLDFLPQRKYVNGELLKVGAYDFYLSIFFQDNPKSSARIFNNQIAISLAKGLTEEAKDNTISFLISKCLTKFFLPKVQERIHELNNRYFGKKINTIKLKYNTSNWGSCSSQGNINISLRLMFASNDVIDYVYIHELAHLVHQNHSDRFWKVVESVMPNYMEKEKYLKEHGHKFYL
jgi:predicted metal-dependent hydrolase